MATGVRRWAAWVGDQEVKGPREGLGVVGAGLGTLYGLRVADELTDAVAAGTIFGALGGVVGLGFWLVCRMIARSAVRSETEQSERLFREFRQENKRRIRSLSRALLDGRGRLPGPFSGYRHIVPHRSFRGSIRQRSDLSGAVDAACTSNGGPRLLVVGQPGYGKTVAVLDIAQHLADHHDDLFGMAVVLNLGGWRQGDRDLKAWMVRTLCDATGPLPESDHLVAEWIDEGIIAPMLDGLDEILDDDLRRQCVQAINGFIDAAPRHVAVVVASRPSEYTAITSPRDPGSDKLAVNAGIELEPLKDSLVLARLREASAEREESSYLADLIEKTPGHPLTELLRVPLWLWLASTLDNTQATKLDGVASADEAQGVLAEQFIDHATTRLGRMDLGEADQGAGSRGLGTKACRGYLAAIAGFLDDERTSDSVTFRFEDLTPPRPSSKQRFTVRLGGVLLWGLVIGLAGGPLFGLIGALFFGLLYGLFDGLAVGLDMHARPTRFRLRWPQKVTVAAWLFLGVVGGIFGSPVVGPVSGLMGGLVAGLLLGLLFGLTQNSVVVPEEIDEGWTASKASLTLWSPVFGLVCGLLFGLVLGLVARPVFGVSGGVVGGLAGSLVLGLVAGPVFGLTFGLAEGGGWYLLLQRGVRRRAYREGSLPEDPVAFVRAGVEVGVFRQTGGGVQFRHREIADRLAAEARTPGLADLRTY